MAADADDALALRPGGGERSLVLRRDGLEHLLDGAQMRLGVLLAAQRDPVGGGDVLVDQQALDDRGEPADVVRQAVEQPRLAAGVAQGDGGAVEVGCHGKRLSRLSRAIIQPRR